MTKRTRPPGVSSRITRAKGTRSRWSTDGMVIDLPVIVDWVFVDPADTTERVRIEARIDLVDDEPAIVQMSFVSDSGLDLVTLQRDFRWSTPLEVVVGLVPRLLREGIDPFAVDLPVTGFPAAALQPIRRRGVLTDEFLTMIARQYLIRGRGYAASISQEYSVSRRTAISWVEKARSRGLLSPPPRRGAVGGNLLRKRDD